MPEISFNFALTEDEALKRYEDYKSKDPFPHIFPALLSSTQIQAYIAMTGMVFPYFPSKDKKEEKVTSASLTMTIGPEILYWDSEGKQVYHKALNKDEPIKLRPNSITFLRPAEQFNIPDYIAVRFNLRITHVHRGLLLGTGPLIDPGYKGYPMIPVHNLTENEYSVRVGEDFINVEFTKISRDAYYEVRRKTGRPKIPFSYKENRGKTFNFNFTKYIDKNVPQRKVKSSLSSVIDQANAQIKKAERGRWLSYGVALIALVAVVIGGYQLTIAAMGIISETRERIEVMENQEATIKTLQKKVKILQLKMRQIEKNQITPQTENSSHTKIVEQPINNKNKTEILKK